MENAEKRKNHDNPISGYGGTYQTTYVVTSDKNVPVIVGHITTVVSASIDIAAAGDDLVPNGIGSKVLGVPMTLGTSVVNTIGAPTPIRKVEEATAGAGSIIGGVFAG